MTNTCMCCGAEIPEGYMICKACYDREIVGPASRRKSAKSEAVEEALLTLKARLNYDIQKYSDSTIDYAFKLGVEKFKLDVDMTIDEMIHQYRTGELK